MDSDICIEFPSRGSTYCHQTYGVYQYDEYPEGSVLEGQQRRRFLNSFATLAEAQFMYPDAQISGPQFQEPSLNHLEGDD